MEEAKRKAAGASAAVQERDAAVASRRATSDGDWLHAMRNAESAQRKAEEVLGMPAAAQPIHLVLAVGLILTDGWLLGSRPQQ